MNRNSKLFVAFLLSVGSLFLLFGLGEAVKVPDSIPGARHIQTLILLGGMGSYFLISEFFLSRGNRYAMRTDWPIILALNVVLMAATVMAAFVERNKWAVLQTAGITLLAVICSSVGAALAARAARAQAM